MLYLYYFFLKLILNLCDCCVSTTYAPKESFKVFVGKNLHADQPPTHKHDRRATWTSRDYGGDTSIAFESHVSGDAEEMNQF